MKHTFELTVTVDIRKQFPLEGVGVGFTTRKVGTREATVRFEVDPSRFGAMARKAAGSSGRKATALHSAIVAKVVRESDALSAEGGAS